MTTRTDDTPPPPPGRIGPTPGPPDPVARANARRLDLIERKYKGGGLTPEEQDELNACARAVGAWAFRPERLAERREVLEEFAGWVEEMRREVEGRRAKARKPLDL